MQRPGFNSHFDHLFSNYDSPQTTTVVCRAECGLPVVLHPTVMLVKDWEWIYQPLFWVASTVNLSAVAWRNQSSFVNQSQSVAGNFIPPVLLSPFAIIYISILYLSIIFIYIIFWLYIELFLKYHICDKKRGNSF